ASGRQQRRRCAVFVLAPQPLGFLIFFIAAAAEGNRTPFDLTEADSEIVAGFATEYSGMRFGFFYFAEYVNVFLLSALTVVLFLGGWNAPLDLGGLLAQVGLTFDPTLAPGQLGIGLLFGVAIVPPIIILALTLPIWVFTRLAFWKALVIGFLLFNVLAVGALLLVATAT